MSKKLFTPENEVDFVVELDGKEIVREKFNEYGIAKEPNGDVYIVLNFNTPCHFTDKSTGKKVSIRLQPHQ